MERVYYTINEESAKAAHEMMSFSDYKVGSLTAEYKGYADKAYDLADKVAEMRPEAAERAYGLAARYSKKMADNLNAKSRIGMMCPSVMISGAGNFPVRRKEKQNAAADRNYKEFQDIQNILDKIRGIANGKEIIRSGDADALEKLEKKLSGLKEEQEQMKAANKAIRMKDAAKGDRTLRDMGYSDEQITELRKPDFCGRIGFPDYALKNNNANIRRIEGRIKKLREEKAQENQEQENQFFRVVENTDIMRLQLFFNDKPDAGTRDVLKKNGFRWSPRNTCWQRQLTDNARYSMKRVLKELEGAADGE